MHLFPRTPKMPRETCEICKTEVDDLISHLESAHIIKQSDLDNEDSSSSNICTDCGEVFIKKCELIRHRMKHIMTNQKAINV